jgi:hypothetical protein
MANSFASRWRKALARASVRALAYQQWHEPQQIVKLQRQLIGAGRNPQGTDVRRLFRRGGSEAIYHHTQRVQHLLRLVRCRRHLSST